MYYMAKTWFGSVGKDEDIKGIGMQHCDFGFPVLPYLDVEFCFIKDNKNPLTYQQFDILEAILKRAIDFVPDWKSRTISRRSSNFMQCTAKFGIQYGNKINVSDIERMISGIEGCYCFDIECTKEDMEISKKFFIDFLKEVKEKNLIFDFGNIF